MSKSEAKLTLQEFPSSAPILDLGFGLEGEDYIPMTREASYQQAQAVIHSIVASHYDRPSLVAQIACEVGADIVEARLLPGQDLNTVELASRYKTSRTPVREALLLIENQDLVEIMPRRRPVVKGHSFDKIREIYRTRATLVEFVAADVAQMIEPHDVELLRSIIDKMRYAVAQNDTLAFLWLNVSFHDHNTRISKNATVKRIIDSLLLRSLVMRQASLTRKDRIGYALEDYVRLVDAYEAKDSFLAAAIMRNNHNMALKNIEDNFVSYDEIARAVAESQS